MFGYPFSGELKVDPSNFKVAHAIIVYRGGRLTGFDPLARVRNRLSGLFLRRR